MTIEHLPIIFTTSFDKTDLLNFYNKDLPFVERLSLGSLTFTDDEYQKLTDFMKENINFQYIENYH